MKVIKNEVKESLTVYLKRVLPTYGYRYKRVSGGDWSSDSHYIRSGRMFFGKDVAWIKNGDEIILYNNNVLKCLVDIVPAWESLTGETVQITLAKQMVEA